MVGVVRLVEAIIPIGDMLVLRRKAQHERSLYGGD